jgi:hypothetical protein
MIEGWGRRVCEHTWIIADEWVVNFWIPNRVHQDGVQESEDCIEKDDAYSQDPDLILAKEPPGFFEVLPTTLQARPPDSFMRDCLSDGCGSH